MGFVFINEHFLRVFEKQAKIHLRCFFAKFFTKFSKF